MENNELLYEELIKLIHESDIETLKKELQNYHNNDIAKVQPDLSEEDQEKLLKALDEEDLSDVVSYVEDFDEFIENMDTETVADIIEGMDVDDAVDALEELDEEEQEEILAKIEDKELVEDIKLIKSYEDEEIGSKMTTNFIVVDRDILVKDAMKVVIKEAEEHDNIMTIYVKDTDNKFYGSIDLKELIIARKNQSIEDIIHTSYPFVYAHELIDECLTKIKEYVLNLVPVLDDDDILIGVITSDDIVEVVDEELGEDYAKLAGLTEEEELDESIFESCKKRLPWLALLMFLAMVVSILISSFEAAISKIAVIVFFQSMILGMAGNCGTQSLAVTIRVLTDEEIDAKKILQIIFKELRIGLLNGFLLGLLSFVSVFAFLYVSKKPIIAGDDVFILSDALQVSFIVALSLFVALAIATVVGTVIPILLKKLKIDPAVASGPFISTINDICAVIIYYGLTTLLFVLWK